MVVCKLCVAAVEQRARRLCRAELGARRGCWVQILVAGWNEILNPLGPVLLAHAVGLSGGLSWEILRACCNFNAQFCVSVSASFQISCLVATIIQHFSVSFGLDSKAFPITLSQPGDLSWRTLLILCHLLVCLPAFLLDPSLVFLLVPQCS